MLFRIYVLIQLSSYCNKVFYNVIQKCFQNHHHLLKSWKQTKAFFKVSQRFFPVLKWTTNSWRGIKNLFRSRQREWQAKVQPNKTRKRQRKKCQGRLSYTHSWRRRPKCLDRRRANWAKCVTKVVTKSLTNTCP